MKIYFGHFKGFNYEKEYYKPIEKSELLKGENLIFPHKNFDFIQRDKDFYGSFDLFIAEVSYPSTGLYRSGTKPASSLKAVPSNFIEYNSPDELTRIVEQIVNSEKIKSN